MLVPQCQESSSFPKANVIFSLKKYLDFSTQVSRKIDYNQFLPNGTLSLDDLF